MAFFKNIGILLWMLTLKKEFLQKKINKKEVAFKLTACSMFKAHFFVVDNREIKLIIKWLMVLLKFNALQIFICYFGWSAWLKLPFVSLIFEQWKFLIIVVNSGRGLYANETLIHKQIMGAVFWNILLLNIWLLFWMNYNDVVRNYW